MRVRRWKRWLTTGVGGALLALLAYSIAESSLPVPFISQMEWRWKCDGTWSYNGGNNCGPASVAMTVDAYGERPGGFSNIDFVHEVRYRMTGTPDNGGCQGWTSFAEMETGLDYFGLSHQPVWSVNEIFDNVSAGKPVIGYVDGYYLQPRLWPQDWAPHPGDVAHLLVVTGKSQDGQWVSVNDPMAYPAEAPGTYTYSSFSQAEEMAPVGPYGLRVGNGLVSDCPQSGGVILYWNNNYNCDNGEGDPGYRQTSSTGAWNISDAFNDQASSVRVPSGWSVMVYEHENRGGGKKCFNSSDSDFANDTFDNGQGVNDKLSSFEVFDHSDCSVPLDAAEFLSQCQYPTVQPGQQFSIWFEVRNTGNTTWRDSTGYGLENLNGETLGAWKRQEIGADVPPGATRRWDIQMTAPSTPGTYRTDWMLKHYGEEFGPYMFIDVTVQQTGPVITVDDVWTTDDNDQEKTSFNAGDPIKLKMTINNRGTSTTTARVTWDVTDPSGNPYPDLSWDGDLDLQEGVWFWSLGKTIPGNAPTGTYSFTGRVDNNGEISSKSTTFYVQGVDVGPLVYDNHIVDDDSTGESSGNGDGVVNCGETVELYVTLHNQGPDTATGVVATISTSDPYVSWLYNTDSSYPDIAGGGTGVNDSDFDFAVDPGMPDGHAIHFNVDAVASNGGPWSDSFDVSVVCIPQCSDPHEPNDTSGEATVISYGTTVSDGDICPAGDLDYYVFSGSAGDMIIADIDAVGIGSSLDSYLYLYDIDGVTELTHNDDYGGYDSHLEYTLPADGAYYLMVRDYSHPNEGGATYFYTISLGGYPHRVLMPLITSYPSFGGSETYSAGSTTTTIPYTTPKPAGVGPPTPTPSGGSEPEVTPSASDPGDTTPIAVPAVTRSPVPGRTATPSPVPTAAPTEALTPTAEAYGTREEGQ